MRRMKDDEFQGLIRHDAYQVFLFTCPATFPFSFASHPWFVVNRKGTVSRWEIFWEADKKDKMSWGHLHKDCWPPSQGIEMFFYSQKYFFKSTLFDSIEGNEGSLAHRMADFIEESSQHYPYCQEYSLRGPNSNTYVQWVFDHFPECGIRLRWNSFGKRYSR